MNGILFMYIISTARVTFWCHSINSFGRLS